MNKALQESTMRIRLVDGSCVIASRPKSVLDLSSFLVTLSLALHDFPATSYHLSKASSHVEKAIAALEVTRSVRGYF